MAKLLPLYPEFPNAAAESVEPKELCHTCTSCSFSGLPDEQRLFAQYRKEMLKHAKLNDILVVKEQIYAEAREKAQNALVKATPRVRSVCLAPDGSPGGLLVVTDYPLDEDDKSGRPLISRTGRYLRSVIEKFWKGPVAFDSAIKCAPRSMEIKDTHIKACRPYLGATVKEVRPKRILAIGPWATSGLLARKPPALSVRKGYSWLNGSMIPIFLNMSAGAARRNPFVQTWFEEDIEWACTTDIDELIRKVPIDGFAKVIATVEDAQAAVADLRSHEWFTWDVETAGNRFSKIFKILCVGMAGKGADDAWVWGKEALSNPAVFAIFADLLKDKNAKKIAHHGKYDMVAAYAAWGIDVGGMYGDTLYWRKLLDTDVAADLETVQELVGMGGGKEESHTAMVEIAKRCRIKSIGKGKEKREVTDADLAQIGPLEHVLGIREGVDDTKAHVYALLPDDILYRYVAKDALSTSRAAEMLLPQLDAVPPIRRVWDKLVGPATDAIAQVEKWGIAASLPRLKSFQLVLLTRLLDLDKNFKDYDPNFNPDSGPQVIDLLFNKLGCTPVSMTDGGQPSTDAATLKALLARSVKGTRRHGMIENIQEYRLLTKQNGTYAEGMMRFVRDDGRIHPSLNIHGARSGRLSCNDPNCQNITKSNIEMFNIKYGKMARDIFVADNEEEVLVELDFSQLEIRVAAVLSGDPMMKEIFLSGKDYHQATAELISQVAWGIPPAQVTDLHRTMAKAVNFGLMYGMSDSGLAIRIGSTKQEAGKIRAGVLGSFKEYAKWGKHQVEIAEKTGYVWTWWDGELARRRGLWRIKDQDDLARSRAKNGSGNCLDAETEALTKRGWVKGFDLTMSDELLTKNQNTGELEWQHPTDLKFFPDYDGPMVEFRSKSFHAISTPAHRWLVTDKHSGKDVEKTSATISRYGDHRIHRTGNFVGEEAPYSDDFIELAGWWLTDGYIRKTRKVSGRPGLRGPKPGFTRVLLYQSERANPEKVVRIGSLLDRLGIVYSTQVRSADCLREWSFKDFHSSELVRLFPERQLTSEFVSKLSGKQAHILLHSMLSGDGNYGEKITFYSGHKAPAEAFQMLAVLCGYAASIVRRDMSKYSPKSKYLNNVPKMGFIWCVTLCNRDKTQIQKKHVREYFGKTPVWCPVVPNTWFVARRSGTVTISGNTPIQGTASDYCLASLIALVNWLLVSGFPAKLVLTVHDSLIFSVKIAYVEQLIEMALKIMTGHNSRGVPIEADAAVGRSWGTMFKLKHKNGQLLTPVKRKGPDGKPALDDKGKQYVDMLPWRDVVLAVQN